MRGWLPITIAIALALMSARVGAEPPLVDGITLAAVGDVLMHTAVLQSAAAHREEFGNEGFNYLYHRVRPALSAADLTLANLETPIAPTTAAGTRAYVFNAPPAAVQALTWAGVDMVNLANNHAYDQGVAGLTETLDQVRAAGLLVVGAGRTRARARQPQYVDVGSYTVAVLGYAQFLNTNDNVAGRRAPHVNLIERREVLHALRKARARANLVVLSVHWGNEYQQQPAGLERTLAAEFCDGGADVIFGHHPHVLQPIEERSVKDAEGTPVRTCLIVYSLGNFISNQSRKWSVDPEHDAAPREGIVAFASFTPRPPRRHLALADWSVAPVWTLNNWPERYAGKAKQVDISVTTLDAAATNTAGGIPAFSSEGDIFGLFPRERLWPRPQKAVTIISQ